MSYTCLPPQAYTSMIKFTIDGRPSVEDIHDLFSALATQLTFATHKYMFRAYNNSFTSEDALQQLASIDYTKTTENEKLYPHNTATTTTTTFNMNRDMGKALLQQFLWTRLIENVVDPLNRTYKDKGIWRLSSKGLCILQDFCLRSGVDAEQFLSAVDATSRLMFLVQVERVPKNDRINCKRRHISSLFAMMIASLPLRQNNQSEAKILPTQAPIQPMRYQQDGSDDSYSAYSNESNSTFSSSANSNFRLPQFADYFPHVRTLPNDLLVGTGIKQPHQVHKICFQQQEALLQTLNPAFNRFRMRAIFTSFLCCTWLIEYCTFASTDEAEALMTEYLNLGWVEFHNKKDKELTHVEASKSILLNVTREGMKIVIDYSRDRYNDFQERLHNTLAIEKQLSVISTASDDINNEPYHQRFSTIDVNNSLSDQNEFSANHPTWTRAPSSISNATYDSFPATSISSIHSYGRSFSYDYFDLDATSSLAAGFSFPNTPSESIKSHSNISTPPLTPTTPTSEVFSVKEGGNSFTLKAILRNAQLRPLFRDFLACNFCVENLDFWIDHDNLRRNYQRQKTNMSSANQQLLFEDAYILWDVYLKPGAARELNIDHNTREEMVKEISFMATVVQTYSLGESTRPEVIMTTHSTYESLMTLLNWFEKVNEQICKLMATDSIPKFVRTAQYKQAVQKQDTAQLKQKKPEKLSIVTKDLYDFPPPPQRKLKETIYL